MQPSRQPPHIFYSSQEQACSPRHASTRAVINHRMYGNVYTTFTAHRGTPALLRAMLSFAAALLSDSA